MTYRLLQWHHRQPSIYFLIFSNVLIVIQEFQKNVVQRNLIQRNQKNVVQILQFWSLNCSDWEKRAVGHAISITWNPEHSVQIVQLLMTRKHKENPENADVVTDHIPVKLIFDCFTGLMLSLFNLDQQWLRKNHNTKGCRQISYKCALLQRSYIIYMLQHITT